MNIRQIPFFNKIHLKSGFSFLLGCLILFALPKNAAAQWNAYFPDDNPLMLPLVASDGEIPQWELLLTEHEQILAVDFKTGGLAVFDRQGTLQTTARLPLPENALGKSGGLWVSQGRIYLKPSADNLIWVFNAHGGLLQKIKLRKVSEDNNDFGTMSIDPRGYIYLLDRQTLEIKIFNSGGGYEGVFLKKGNRPHNLPDQPESFCMDQEGNFWIAMYNAESGLSQIAKFSFQRRFLYMANEPRVTHYRTLEVDAYRNLYATAPQESQVLKFDSRCRMICRFTAGCPAGLAVDCRGAIFIVSPKGNTVNRFIPSHAINLIDRGNRALTDNRPDNAEEYFKEALILNNQLEYIHSILGEVYYRQQRFAKAMSEFAYLRDYWRYSQSLVSFRHGLLTDYGPLYGVLLTGLIGTGIVIASRRHGHSRFKGMVFISRSGEIPRNIQSIIKPGTAWSMAGILAVSHYCSWYFTNPIFISERQVFSLWIFGRDLAAVLILMSVGSGVAYKMGELFQGRATYSGILTATAVSLFPMLPGFPLLALLSHILTYEELWIYQWANNGLIFGVVGLFLKILKDTEDFTWSKTLGFGLLNLAACGLVFLFIGFLVGVNQQLAGFLSDLFREVYTRVIG